MATDMTPNDLDRKAREAMIHAMAAVVLASTGETRESVGDIAYGWVCEVQGEALDAALRLAAQEDVQRDAECWRMTRLWCNEETRLRIEKTASIRVAAAPTLADEGEL